MNFEVNKQYHGFKLIEEKPVAELNAKGRLFLHEKSGAKLFNLENDDDNKVFSISFRTPPENSTGLPHILEHSVLCGSRKFPVKEPFVELLKGSLNTFLNAMTFPDKTMYPVASKNDKDFLNLMDVYMDAVLYPNIYKYPEIFRQEGWHYEINNKAEELSYKGVVYNEMKGAYSSPESILMRNSKQALFPDNTYGVSSGGDPEVIPELSLEEFLSFHKNYYHPSNSYIFLYGNGELEEQLKFINDKYLKDFDKIDIDSQIKLHKGFDKLNEVKLSYPISNEETETEKTYFSLNYACGKATDKELSLALEILQHMLLETSASPLKKALIDANLGKDVFGQLDNSVLQPTMSIIVKNSDEDKKEKLLSVVRDTLADLVSNGIDKKLIEASINIKEFSLREAEEPGAPKGLLYGIRCMDSWLYDEDPTIHLAYEDSLKAIRKAAEGNYFESLIEKYILNNTHAALVTLTPKKGLAEERAEQLNKQLKAIKAKMSDKELEELIQENKKLVERQTSTDTKEMLETIPLLAIEDISKTVEKLSVEEKVSNEIKVLFSTIFTSGIVYTNLLFDTSGVKQDKLQYISLLSDMLAKVSTKNYSYEALSNEINIHTGGVGFQIEVFEDKKDIEKFSPKLAIKAKALASKLDKLSELISEIAGNSSFEDEKRLKEIIQEAKSRQEMYILNRGHMVASSRLGSYFSPTASYVETLTGISYFKFITDLEKNFESKIGEIKAGLKEVADTIFSKKNLIVGLTCDKEEYSAFDKQLPKIISTLSDNKAEAVNYKFDLKPKNEALLTQAKVQYVAKGYNFKKLGFDYSGSLEVLKTAVSMDYLWNRVRVQGGAYGCFAIINRNGRLSFASYRDPNLTETLKVYDEVADYIANFDADEREITKYIIGTISNLDTPLTPSQKGEEAVARYLRKITIDEIQKEREEVLSTNKEILVKYAPLFKAVMDKNYICVLGNEAKLKEETDLFKGYINLFE